MAVLELYDVSTASAPQHLSTWEEAGGVFWTRPGGSTVRAQDGRFYICRQEQVIVVDATDAYHPFPAARYPGSPREFRAWPGYEGIDTAGGPAPTPVWITLQPGRSVIYTRQEAVPATAPLGAHHLEARLVDRDGVEMDRDRITFEVVSSGD